MRTFGSGGSESLTARPSSPRTLRSRWLGRVKYRDAQAIQMALHRGSDDYLLLLEHPPTYTMGLRVNMDHMLLPPMAVGAELIRTNRGGETTFHGPGQLVGYPVLTVGMTVPEYVRTLEQWLIDTLIELGLDGVGRVDGRPGVWVSPDAENARKIAAVGTRVTRGRSMHGFALNVDPDLTMFKHIIPCGIRDRGVTSLVAEKIDVTMQQVVDSLHRHIPESLFHHDVERADNAWHVERDAMAEFTRTGAVRSEVVPLRERKPDWMVVKANMGDDYRGLRKTLRSLDLVTVCEEAGCPNIYECWADGTATFMINGERCTRACGFCLVDTQKPEAQSPGEPTRVADAVVKMKLSHAVITTVARDDLADGGAGAFAQTIGEVRAKSPQTQVETLISDCKGDPASLQMIFDARPDVLNHNIETVLRLQRAVRPSASYARSLAVLARAKANGLTTKSGMIVGMGETFGEALETLRDLRAVGVDIVTVGQYLRPTESHLPVARWWTPDEFETLRLAGMAMGFVHVQSSPLTRSSYHAREAAESAASVTSTPVTLR